MENSSSKKVILFVVVFFVFLISIIGFTFAFFRYMRTSSTESSIQAGKVMLGYIEETNGISLTNAMPISDTNALNTTDTNAYFDFYITYAIPSMAQIKYEIDIEDITDQLEDVEDGTLKSVATNRVKVALENRSETLPDKPLVVAPTYFSSIALIPASNQKPGYKLYEKTVSGEANDYYRLYLWLAEVDSTGEVVPMIDTDGVEGIRNQAFSVKINVQALAQVNG